VPCQSKTRAAQVATISPTSFSPEIQNPFSGVISVISGLNESSSGYHPPFSE